MAHGRTFKDRQESGAIRRWEHGEERELINRGQSFSLEEQVFEVDGGDGSAAVKLVLRPLELSLSGSHDRNPCLFYHD